MSYCKAIAFWGLAASALLLRTGTLARAGDENEAQQALAVCDQLRSTLAETTTMLVETKKELAETKERLARLEEAMAKGSATKDSEKPTNTKVAVVNMTKVLRNYRLAQYRQIDIDDERKKLEAGGGEWAIELPAGGECSDQGMLAEVAAKVAMMKTLKVTNKSAIALKQHEDDARRHTFEDIQAAARVYAKARNIDLVFYYDENPKPERSGPSDSGRICAGSCRNVDLEWLSPDAPGDDSARLRQELPIHGEPLFAANGVDITCDILYVLNWNIEQPRPRAK